MINELHNLSISIKGLGIQTQEWVKDYKELPNTPCVRFWITEDASISRVEQLSTEQTKVLRKYGNNQGSFPAFNLYGSNSPQLAAKGNKKLIRR